MLAVLRHFERQGVAMVNGPAAIEAVGRQRSRLEEQALEPNAVDRVEVGDEPEARGGSLYRRVNVVIAELATQPGDGNVYA